MFDYNAYDLDREYRQRQLVRANRVAKAHDILDDESAHSRVILLLSALLATVITIGIALLLTLNNTSILT